MRRCDKPSASSPCARYCSMGVEIMDMTQAEFAAYVRTDFDKWRRVAREANIVIE
jgi:tripartite-type tricarboxylate transporter receptor subunit TctC